MHRHKTKHPPPAQNRIQQLNPTPSADVVAFALLYRVAAFPPPRQTTAGDQLPCRAVQSADHLVLIQPPTSVMVAMTATSMTPSRTVYSTSAAPFSSFLSFLISCDT